MNKKLRKIYVAIMGRSDKANSTRKAMLAFAIRLGSAAFIYISHIILARWLGSDQFGVYTYVWTWVIIFGSVSTLGFSMVMVKELPTYFKRSQFAEYLGLIYFGRIFSFILAVLITIFGVATVYLLGDLNDNIFIIPLMLGLVCVPLFAIVDVQEGMCRANEWVYLSLLPNYLIRPMLVLVFSGLFLFSGVELNAKVIMIACIIASFFTAVIQLILIEIKITKKIEKLPKKILWKPWLGLALPLFITDSFMILMSSTDIVLLQYFMQPEDIGVYYAAVKTTLLVAFIYFAVVLASSNKFAEHWNDDDKDKLTKAINHSVIMTFVPSLFASIGIMSVGYWFLLAYGDDFTHGYPVIVILSIGAILRAATGPTEWMMTMMGQQKTVLWATGAAAIANIVLNIIFIPIWGLEGAAGATTITMVSVSLYLFIRVRNTLKIPIKFAGII